MFSISAVSGDKWLEDIPYDHVEFAAASDYWLEWCNNRNDYLSTSASEDDYADLCDRCKCSLHRSRNKGTFFSIGQTQHTILV